MLAKSEVQTILKNFISYADKQFNKPVKIVRSDNGTEFMCLSAHFRALGIIHQNSCVATPQQNGRVERKHRHILNVARALLFQASLPIEFWGEAILTASYLINRTPSKLHQGRTPYELLHATSQTIVSFVFSAQHVMSIAHHAQRTSFIHEVACVCFLVTHLGKRAGKCSIWTQNR